MARNENKVCQKCGSSVKVRKIRRKNENLCADCRKSRPKPKPEFNSIGEARQAYNLNRESYHGKLPDFDELFDLFSNDCISFFDIGLKFGLSRGEEVRQIYNKYFKKFLREKSGMARQKVCSRLSKLSKLSSAANKFNQLPVVKSLLEITGGKLEIKPVVSYHYRSGVKIKYLQYVKFSGRFITINGYKCLVKNVFAWQRMSDYALRLHLRINISRSSLMNTDFLIIVSEKDGEKLFFIIPVSMILGIFPDKTKRLFICIPSTNIVYHNQPPRIDFWKYEKAWHLLEMPKHAPQEEAAVPA